MDYSIIFLIIVIIVLAFFMYRYFFPEKSTIAGKVYLPSGVPAVPLNTLDNPTSKIYTFDFWIYVNSLNGIVDEYNGEDDEVPKFGNSDNENGLIFSIAESKNSASNYVSFDLHQKGIFTFFNGTENPIGTFLPSAKIMDFPLRRWVYIIVSVNNTRVDLYMDGKLLQSRNVSSVNTIPSNYSIYFGNKLDAYLAGLNRTATFMDTNTAYQNYWKGNNTGMKISSNFSISLNFLKNNSIARNVSIL